MTKETIQNIIQDQLPSSLNSNDLLVITFHGHGYTKITSKEKKFGYIVPYRARQDPSPSELIDFNELANWVTNYCPTKHILLLMDCCFSGMTLMRGANANISTEGTNNIEENLEYAKYISTLMEKNCYIVVNAGTHDQMIKDNGGSGNSILTESFISLIPKLKRSTSISKVIGDLQELGKERGVTFTNGTYPGHLGGEIFLAL